MSLPSSTDPPWSRRLRVVFLTHNFPRFAGDVSGAFLATLARALSERGHDVRVIAPADRGEVGQPTFEGVVVRRVRYAAAGRETLAYRGTMAEAIRHPRGIVTALALGRALRRAAREEMARGADLVHAHWWVPAGLAAPPEAPLVLTVHGTDAVLLSRSRLVGCAAAPLFRRARVVTAVSATAASAIARATGRAINRVHVQPMPIDTARYQRWSRGGNGLLLVARLTRQKRVDLALQALALVPEVPLTVIGDGPQRPDLEALRDRLGLSTRVRFLGARSPADVAEALTGADLALFPAREEGFGLAAAEALMAGVPVVACEDGGGVLSVVPASGAGRRAKPEPESFAHAIRELRGDASARESARQEGVHWRRALGPHHVAQAFEGWYREAIHA
jgi:glycosyltransferase involved in cell wall biosynthesis